MRYATFLCAALFFFLSHQRGHGQVKKKIREYEKNFQLSLFPGIGTNGVTSGSYYNDVSLNIFGGLSAGNRYFEVGLISNGNLKTTTGVQIAGLANVIGANAFINLTLSEERTLVIKEDFQVSSKGIQLAGLLNYVLDNSAGLKLTAGLNVTGDDFKGVQLAGIGNSTGGNAAGIHLAGIYNVSKGSVGGFQISSGFNFTDAQLSGGQTGLVNKARVMKGKKSTPPTRSRGFQIGLINFSKEMDGLQIGLINFGGDARGKQIGLLNFFNKNPSKEHVRMGTPIGLLNYGSKGSYFRLFGNEIFSANLEYTTGNCLNCSHVINSEMPFDDVNQIYNQNALILGYDHFLQTWGFGYGFQKALYNKFSMIPSPFNKRRVMTYGLKFIHLNHMEAIDHSFNLVTKLNFDYGKKFSGLYLFSGLSLNYFLHDDASDRQQYSIRSLTVSTGKMFNIQTEFWPGYTVGIQF